MKEQVGDPDVTKNAAFELVWESNHSIRKQGTGDQLNCAPQVADIFKLLISIWPSTEDMAQTVNSDVERMSLVTVDGLQQWNKHRADICEELASNHHQWTATIRDIREADSYNHRS
ncbi:unnamed protein product [Dibothriocephalus latus]|uniref:Uncharacterized protein n=1 Tax=Dibothriocephalus latus TaxID=60516 RepID=A0A3P7P9K2_DIBLA|nr:unnamed protein product [Dibothriocephalus latus]